MDGLFIKQETIAYVLEADGTLDLAALQLQPASIVINRSAMTITPSCIQWWLSGPDLKHAVQQ